MDASHEDCPSARRGATRRLITFLLGGLALLSPLVGSGPARGKGKKKKRKKKKNIAPIVPPPGPGRVPIALTFGNSSAITIPAGAPGTSTGKASPYPSVINVAGFANGRILDVNVTLHGFSHEDPNDVHVLLVATQLPNNDVTLMSGVGGLANVQNLNLTFDDQAANFLGIPLVTGTFKPTSADTLDPYPDSGPSPSGNVSLAVFNNGNPNGTWQLWVADDSSGATGSIGGGWSLQITAEVDA
jgi:hypothetical protein